MYNLYEIQVSKKTIASLAYILLESNVKFSNKHEFNTIMYKFYNYVKDDIEENNGIVFTETLRNKISEFIVEYKNLENPSMKEEIVHSFDVAGKTTNYTGQLEEEFTAVSTSGSVHMASAKITNSGTSFYPTISLGLLRPSDNYTTIKQVTTKSFTEKFSYFKVGYKYYSSSYAYLVLELYDEEDTLITTYQKTTGESPKDYNFKINYVYDSSSASNIYSHYNHFIYNHEISESAFSEINLDKLTIGDVYSADDIDHNQLRKFYLNTHNIVGKMLNGESKDHKYRTLMKLLYKETCPKDKNLYKYLTVMKNRDSGAEAAFISTKPFYYTGYTNTKYEDVCLANISNADSSFSMYFQWFTSTDFVNWTKKTSVVGGSGNGYETVGAYNIMDYRYPIYLTGYDVVYNTYPIFYGTKAIKSVPSHDTANFDASKRLKIWRNSHDVMTLHTLPAGATFYMGKYRVENSPVVPLTFAVASFSDSLDRVCALSTHKIEYMNYNTVIPKTAYSEKGYAPAAELYQWLNTSKRGNSWWQSYSDDDLPPTEENCLAGSKGYYAHKDGFLSGFSEAEKGLMEDRQLNFGQYVGSAKPSNIAKVHIPSAAELGCGTPSMTTGKAKYTYIHSAGLHHNLKYHKKGFSDSLFENGDEFGGAIDTKNPVFLRYDNQYKIGVGTGTVSPSSVDRNSAYCVQPFIVLKDAPVEQLPDEHGVFKLILPEDLFEEFSETFETEVKINNSCENNYDTQMKVLECFENFFETKRNTGESRTNTFNASRCIENNIESKFEVVLYNTLRFEKQFETSRRRNFVYVLRFQTRRKATSNFEKTYYTERNTHQEFKVNIKYHGERRVIEKFVERYSVAREVLGLFTKLYNPYRFITNTVENIYQTIKSTINHKEFKYPTERRVKEDMRFIGATRRRVANSFINSFGTSRNTYIRHEFIYPAERKIQEPFEMLYTDVARNIIGYGEAIYPTYRHISEPSILVFETKRQLSEKHMLKYSTTRRTIAQGAEKNVYATEIRVLNNADASYSSEIRQLENINESYLVNRLISNNFDKLFETELQLYSATNYIYETVRRTSASSDSIYSLVRSIRNNFTDEYLAKIEVLNNSLERFETQINNIEAFESHFGSIRKITELSESIYDAVIKITNNSVNEYGTKVNNLSNVKLDFETMIRLANSLNESFATNIAILNNFEDTFMSERAILNSVEVRYSTIKATLNTLEASYLSERAVLNDVECCYETVIGIVNDVVDSYQLERAILNDFNMLFQTCINLNSSWKQTFESIRKLNSSFVEEYLAELSILNNSNTVFETNLSITNSVEVSFEVIRKVECLVEESYETDVRTISEFSQDYKTNINILNNSINVFSLRRYLNSNSCDDYSTIRVIRNNSFKLYEVLRDVIANSFNEANLLRYIVQNAEFLSNCERYILNNITSDHELCRYILNDFQKINDAVIYTLNNAEEKFESKISITEMFGVEALTLRSVLAMTEDNFKSKRIVINENTSNQYVSKDNLMLYTVLLRNEITEFVEEKITEEFQKRGL